MLAGQTLRFQRYTLWALVLREMQLLRGERKWGYLWSAINPLSFLALFMLIRVVLRNQPVMGEALQPPVLITGFLLFSVFRDSVSRGAKRFGVGEGVYVFRQIRPPELLAAQLVLRWYFLVTLMALLLAACWAWGMAFDLDRWPALVLGPLLLAWFTYGAALVARAAVVALAPMHFVVQGLCRVLFWTSGIFFSPASMPAELWWYFRWNPVTICLELTRAGLGIDVNEQMIRPGYVAGCGLALTCVGLLFSRYLWRKKGL